jgi:hypothetical protein
MKSDLDNLKKKYQQIADLTRPRCMEQCHEPGGCCAPRYCDQAEARAKECGVPLPAPAHGTLKYMGATGCVVPPWLRPLCAVHVCDYHVTQDANFAEVYLKLRDEICRAEDAAGLEWPEGMARNYWE